MSAEVKKFKNSFSLMFGILCFCVVYMHSTWSGGFDVFSIGTENDTIRKIISLFLMSVVPSFFILWGYLSCKYLDNTEGSWAFIKKKIIQFYPIYLFFFLINVIVRIDYMLTIPMWKLFLAFIGLYYESGLWGGGNIYLVVNLVLLTMFLFKLFNISKSVVFIFTLCCLILTKKLPHESSLCYVQYFGYYSAFFLGLCLNHIGYFENKKNNWVYNSVFYIILLVSLGTPFLNFLGVYYVEIEYNPNSPEHLLFCSFLIYIINIIICKYKLYNVDLPIIVFTNFVGNNAYRHFIVQSHVIRIIIYFTCNVFCFNRVAVQLFVIFFTSFISVYIVLPLYSKLELYAKLSLDLLLPSGTRIE